MTAVTKCPQCGRPRAVGDGQDGLRVRCKGCDTPFTLSAGGGGGRRPRARNRRRERVLLWAYRVAACLALAGGLAYLLVHLSRHYEVFAPTVTRANFDRIELGMPEAAVRGFLGKPDEVDDKVLELSR